MASVLLIHFFLCYFVAALQILAADLIVFLLNDIIACFIHNIELLQTLPSSFEVVIKIMGI